MKRRTVRIMIAMAITTVLVECSAITTDGAVETKTAVEKATQVKELKVDKTEVYYSNTKSDFDKLNTILENRNGKIIIEIIEGTVLDDDGNGVDDCGYYIHYDTTRFSKGDKVQTVFVYNSETNAIDDILYRTDTLLSK